MAPVAEMPSHAHWLHPLDHWVRLSAYTARRAHDQSVLVQVRMSTVDAIAQRLLQPPKQVLNSGRPPLFSSGDGDFNDIWLHLW